MNQASFSWPRRWAVALGGLVLAGLVPGLAAEAVVTGPATRTLTNVWEAEQLVREQPGALQPVRLQGVVCWARPEQGRFVLQDASATALLEMDPQPGGVETGQTIRLEGYASPGHGAASLAVGTLELLADGAHGLGESTGTLTLKPGKHCLQVKWTRGYNCLEGLAVCYEMPGLSRRCIPDSALYHPVVEPVTGRTNWLPGVLYQVRVGPRPGETNALPGPAVQTGVTSNFTLNLRTNAPEAELEFRTWLEVPAEALYTFFLVPEGRPHLFIEHPRLEVLPGKAERLRLRQPLLGQSVSRPGASEWGQTEGVVSFLRPDGAAGVELELASGLGQMRVSILEREAPRVPLMLGSRLRLTGICRSTRTLDGQEVLGELWVPSMALVQVLELPPEVWSDTPLSTVRELQLLAPSALGPMVHVRGQVRALGPGPSLVLADETGALRLDTSQALPDHTGGYLEAVGELSRGNTNVVLKSRFFRQIECRDTPAGPLPVLTTAAQVKRLNRDDALRGYPVRLRGVLTWRGGSGVVLQDDTSGVFVDEFHPEDAAPRHLGDCWEIEGVTTAQFSPMVRARRSVRLGRGELPQPVHPARDQLLNGSLDTEYVEVQGVVAAVGGSGLTLLTHGGKLQVGLPERRAEDLKGYENALIRIRGCLWAVKDEATHVLRVGEIQIHDPEISIEQPAPADPFQARLKRVPELLLFDAQASALQPVRVAGQVIHVHQRDCYLLEGTNGLRAYLKSDAAVQVGERVEVVGFPLLDGPVPVLREASVRRLGLAPLPPPRPLASGALLNKDYDATWVALEATLVNLSSDQDEQILGLQAGASVLVARLDRRARGLESLPVGSRLQVEGVYVGKGGGREAGRSIDSFELLLNSPAGVRVLARPSWWTLKRLLTMVGVLAAVLVAASVWIGLLRQRVEQRTLQLREEIRERERAEQQGAVEAERSRIARDLHDDLGSSLTEICLLADAGPGAPPTLDKASQRFRLISEKGRALVRALDVIVWLVNPRKDALPFLAGYLGSYAEEYLAASGLACRVKIPLDIPLMRLPAEVRHGLFLAVKEVLHNIVCHAHASEVVLEVMLEGNQFITTIADNGCGFQADAPAEGNGLANLRDRLARMGGQCEIHSRLEAGTRVALRLPLPAPAHPN